MAGFQVQAAADPSPVLLRIAAAISLREYELGRTSAEKGVPERLPMLDGELTLLYPAISEYEFEAQLDLTWSEGGVRL